jgi:hypothetical protein
VATIVVSAGQTADTAYRDAADMREHHPRFPSPAPPDARRNPAAWALARSRFKAMAGRRAPEYPMRAGEPEAGRAFTGPDTGSSLVTTTTVSPHDGASPVRIATAQGWRGAEPAVCSSACSRRG